MPYLYQKRMVDFLNNLCVLAPQINEKNINFYKEKAKSHNLLIDNAVFEGKEIPEDKYINLIKEIKPTFAILPDKFKNFKTTFSLHKKYLSVIKENCQFPIAVFQPLYKNASVKYYHFLEFIYWCIDSKIEYISLPYIPNIETKKFYSFTDREEIINLLLESFPSIKIHLLGIEHKSDFHLLKYKNVYSLDTTFVYANAYNRKNFCFIKAKHGLNFETTKVNRNVLLYLKQFVRSIKNENSIFGGFTF